MEVTLSPPPHRRPNTLDLPPIGVRCSPQVPAHQQRQRGAAQHSGRRDPPRAPALPAGAKIGPNNIWVEVFLFAWSCALRTVPPAALHTVLSKPFLRILSVSRSRPFRLTLPFVCAAFAQTTGCDPSKRKIDFLFEAGAAAMQQLKGSYSCLALVKDVGLVAFRDPNGIRCGMLKSVGGQESVMRSKCARLRGRPPPRPLVGCPPPGLKRPLCAAASTLQPKSATLARTARLVC
eukprot:350235-Chlamydomonas_euryale.AAC.1